MHTPTQMIDGRKNIQKKEGWSSQKLVHLQDFSIRTELGRWIAVSQQQLMDEHVKSFGGYSCGFTRDFMAQHINGPTALGWLRIRWPGLEEVWLGAFVLAHGEVKGQEQFLHKLYRSLWGCHHIRATDQAAARHGPCIGPRYWNNHKVLTETMRELQEVLFVYGPSVKFRFDATKPHLKPVPYRD